MQLFTHIVASQREGCEFDSQHQFTVRVGGLGGGGPGVEPATLLLGGRGAANEKALKTAAVAAFPRRRTRNSFPAGWRLQERRLPVRLIENSCSKLGRPQTSPPIDGARRGRQMNRAAPQWTLILGSLIVSLSHLWPGTGVLVGGGGGCRGGCGGAKGRTNATTMGRRKKMLEAIVGSRIEKKNWKCLLLLLMSELQGADGEPSDS